MDDGRDEGPGTQDRVVSGHGKRVLAPLSQHLANLSGDLVKNGALGLILVDATPLLEIERLYGALPFRTAVETLAQRVRARVTEECGDDFYLTSGALEEEHLLVFLPRARSENDFYVHELPMLADELRAYVSLCMKAIVYPYLRPKIYDVPVGSGLAFYRAFQRPEIQIRKLIEHTRSTAKFEREQRSRRRSEMLRRIVLERSVKTVFEPIVTLQNRSIIGYEALSRGPEETGLRDPMTLFGVAEDSDLEFELDTLCRRQALHNARGLRSDQRLFLNILPSCVRDPNFEGERVREILGELGLAPANLVLEISERQAIENFPIFKEAMDRFKSLGFGIALDDMGAGFSSLDAALELSPDFLKIDMSLVRGIDDNHQKQELLRGLQNLGTKMKALLIAEGIETRHELRTIQDLGIALGQGFYLGRARPTANSPEDGPSD